MTFKADETKPDPQAGPSGLAKYFRPHSPRSRRKWTALTLEMLRDVYFDGDADAMYAAIAEYRDKQQELLCNSDNT